MPTKIQDAMKNNKAMRVQLATLAAESLSRAELIRELRTEVRVKEAYIRGMLEANPSAAPTAEYLDSIIS